MMYGIAMRTPLEYGGISGAGDKQQNPFLFHVHLLSAHYVPVFFQDQVLSSVTKPDFSVALLFGSLGTVETLVHSTR